MATKRKMLGISQRELSRRVGIWEMGIQQIESGKRALQFTELIDVAAILGLDPVELVKQAIAESPPRPD